MLQASLQTIHGLEADIGAILETEKEEKEMRVADMEMNKASNLMKHKAELANRPARDWFQSEREKKAAVRSVRDEMDRKKASLKEKSGDVDFNRDGDDESKRSRSDRRNDKRQSRAESRKSKADAELRSEQGHQKSTKVPLKAKIHKLGSGTGGSEDEEEEWDGREGTKVNKGKRRAEKKKLKRQAFEVRTGPSLAPS